MSMLTNLAGRLRNTSLPLTNGLMPLFEAVVNSIHSIDQGNKRLDHPAIIVSILRKPKQEELDLSESKGKRGPTTVEDITGFTILDVGVGFTDANTLSFKTLDSDYKAAEGCRGVGRLLWLKAFERVFVKSCYSEDGTAFKERTFSFTASLGVSDEKIVDSQLRGRSTEVHLEGFVPRYRDACRKTAKAIADSIVEHCLWYFIRPGGAPRILVVDQAGGAFLELQSVFDNHMHSSAKVETLEVKGKTFDLTHVKLRSASLSGHTIALCANNRLVSEEKLAGRIPGLHSALQDRNGSFFYACYVGSPFLDENARPERTGFNIQQDSDPLYENEISLNDISKAVIGCAEKHLTEYVLANLKKGRKRVDEFVAHKAPRYRPILSRIADHELDIDPLMPERELELLLHKHLFRFEQELLNEGHDIMDPKLGETEEMYKRRLQAYLGKVEDLKKSDLANYVAHRKTVLDLLSRAIERGGDGNYVREDLIHGLIMPMRKDSTEVPSDRCNLWLIDERLAFHNYLASDKPLSSMPVTGSLETKEPDLLVLNVFDNPTLVSEGSILPLASLIVVELKRPMRDHVGKGEKEDPIEQALGYLEKAREGKLQTSAGRPIPRADEVPGFCYIICDITPTVQSRCRMHGLTHTADRMGYFGYNANFKAYVEVISFDRLVNGAKQRNRAFFDKLGLPTT